MKIQIDFAKPDQKGESTYLTWILQGAIITSYQSSSLAGYVKEQCTLNFTKITRNSLESGEDISPNPGWRPLHP
jgi:type VI protein secretion system component Hcp